MNTSEDINFTKLQKEFKLAKEADEKYSRENDAKFRAVNQKVGSYEEFCDIVAASNLKPLDRKDIFATDKAQQPWNSLYSSKNADTNISTKVDTAKTDGNTIVDSCNKFMKIWKSLKSDGERISFLLQFERNTLEHIFICDIPMNVLEDSVRLFVPIVNNNNCSKILALLYSFTKSKRFQLSMKFFGKQDRQNISDLFQNLNEIGCDVSNLERIYGL